MSFAFVFPGQGSQSLKMMDGFKDLDIVKQVFSNANSTLNIDFLAMLAEGTTDNINQTVNTQPLMLCAGYATYLAWLENTKKTPTLIAGHSLGEWTALVASGVIEFEDALRLVKLRAEFMQDAVKPGDGAMAAVLGLEDDKIVSICNEVQITSGGIVAGVNFNSPGQVVIAGSKNAVEIASNKLKEAGARRVQLLPVSVPSHCELMKSAADKLIVEMSKIEFCSPKIPVLQNVNANVQENVSGIKRLLIEQLFSPVLWSATINNIVSRGITNIVECGPGKVLSGLNKRINEDVISYNLHTMDDIEKLNIVL